MGDGAERVFVTSGSLRKALRNAGVLLGDADERTVSFCFVLFSRSKPCVRDELLIVRATQEFIFGCDLSSGFDSVLFCYCCGTVVLRRFESGITVFAIFLVTFLLI